MDIPKYTSQQRAMSGPEYFEIIKSYARHEDNLLNNRINWCLLVNSFLFTALALITQQLDVLSGDFSGWHPFPGKRSIYGVAVFSIGITGALLTLASSLGVVAATIALDRLNFLWKEHKGDFPDHVLLPDMLGAGDDRANKLGILYPRMLISILLLVWAAIVIVSGCFDLRALG